MKLSVRTGGRSRQWHASAGFTLVEMLIYMAVMVLVTTASVTTLLSLDDVLIRNQTERALTAAATVSLERLLHDIRGAASVNTGLSDFVTSPNILVLETEGAATTTRFYVSGGTLFVDVNGVTQGPLTAEEVSVVDFDVTHYVGSGFELESELVRVALTIHAESKAASTTETFYTSAVIRGTYE